MFNGNQSQYVLLKRLMNHIDINYVVPTEMVKLKKGKKKPNSVLNNLVIQSYRLRM